MRGVRLHYVRTGSGNRPAVVLVHGFSDNGRCWARVARVLESRFDVVMPDARNHGGSDHGRASPADLVDDLAGVIEGLGLDRPAVVGHSPGGRTAADLAAARPELVSRLVLEDPVWRTVDAPEDASTRDRRLAATRAHIDAMQVRSLDEIIEQGRAQHPDWDDDDLRDWARAKLQMNPDAMAGLETEGWEAAVERIGCPTLLVHGDPGRGLVTPEVAADVARRNPNIQVAHVPDSGHNIRRENLDGYLAVVAPFLGYQA